MPSAAELELTADHRQAFDALVALSLAELRDRFPRLSSDLRITQADLLALVDELVDLYGSAASTLGADYYDDLRAVSNVSGPFRAVPAELPTPARTETLVRWGTGPLFSAEPDLVTTQTNIEGGLQRIVADADRNSVFRSINADPEGRGWSRQTTGKSCSFCVLIASRGAVFSAATADFSAHDHCDCAAIPRIGGEPVEVQPYTPSQRFRTQSARDRNNAALRAALRTP